MKKSICLAVVLLALNLTPVFGQPAGTLPAPGRAQRLVSAGTSVINPMTGLPLEEQPELTKFNLDFPGGTPAQLVKAIEKASGKPLNVIIADEDANLKLPPVKVNDLDVAKLFKTLQENSRKYDSDHDVIKASGFMTLDKEPSDSSLWTFSSYTKPSALTRFDLDFPGGPPELLVKAIEKATGKPLNVIIPTEGADVDLPPLKMNDVDVSRLFQALQTASVKQVQIVTANYYGSGLAARPTQSYQNFNTSYGFKTDGALSDNSVWYFHVEKPAAPPVTPVEKVSQFYPLAEFLNRGFTVDDITTAIQTGWKMAGVTPTPELSYHKETMMLIVFGEPGKLDTINKVLNTLPTSKMTRNELNETRVNIHDLRQDVGDLKAQIQELKQKVSSPGTLPNGAVEIK